MGEIVFVKGLSDFCKRLGISRRGLYHVMSGKQENYKGYKCRRIND